MYSRDLELIRKLLLCVESPGKVDLSQYGKDEICYQYELLIGAGYVVGSVVWNRNEAGERLTCKSMVIAQLTRTGQELLNIARDPLVWDTAMKHLGERAATISFADLILYLEAIANSDGVHFSSVD